MDAIKLIAGGSKHAAFNLAEKMLLVQFCIALFNYVQARCGTLKIRAGYFLYYTAKMTVHNTMHPLLIHYFRAGDDLAPMVAGSKVLVK